MHLCDYGCGKQALYQFKNKKWCCEKSHQQCIISRKHTSIISQGHKVSKETKDKIRNSKIGKSRSLKTKLKISRSNIGNKHTQKTKEKIRAKMLGKVPWNKGLKNCFTKSSNEKRKNKFIGNKNPAWKGGYSLAGIPTYYEYINKLYPIEECRKNLIDENILEVKCAYCGSWFIPTLMQVTERIRVINGTQAGEQRLYNSNDCKTECPIYNQKKYPKDHKPATSREVQPELRQIRFKLDNYTCQICNKHQDELDVGLHCHHIEGIRWEPLESADVDKVVTLCKNCHKEVHKKEGCGYSDMKCN